MWLISRGDQSTGELSCFQNKEWKEKQPNCGIDGIANIAQLKEMLEMVEVIE